MIDNALLDKTKCYCTLCLANDILKPLKYDDKSGYYLPCLEEHKTSYRKEFKDGEWVIIRGLSKNSPSSNKCAILSYSTQKKNGNFKLIDKNVHELAEKNIDRAKIAKYQKNHKIGIFSDESHKRAYETQKRLGVDLVSSGAQLRGAIQSNKLRLENGTHPFLKQNRTKNMDDNLLLGRKSNNIPKDGICTIYGKFSNDRNSQTGICKQCAVDVAGQNMKNNSVEGFCKLCNKRVSKRHPLTGFCVECTQKINAELSRIARDKLNDKIDANIKNLHIHFNEKLVNINSFDNLFDIPGVWSLSGKDKNENIYCLTCGQTENLGKELNWALRVLINKNLQNQEAFNPGCTGRWYLIQQYDGLQFKIICNGERNKERREFIEALYAVKNNALYWKPSITQQYVIRSIDSLQSVMKDLGIVSSVLGKGAIREY
jgi:hypothetical protein